MSEPIKTLTVDELVAKLTHYKSDTKIFISSDEEGNSYGTIGLEGFEFSEEDNAIVLYPIIERLEFDEVFPKRYELEEADERVI